MAVQPCVILIAETANLRNDRYGGSSVVRRFDLDCNAETEMALSGRHKATIRWPWASEAIQNWMLPRLHHGSHANTSI